MKLRMIFSALAPAILTLSACTAESTNQASRFATGLGASIDGTWSQTDTAACSKLLTGSYAACVFDSQNSRVKSIRFVCEPSKSVDEWKAAYKAAEATPNAKVKAAFTEESGIGDAAVVRTDDGKIEGLYTYVRDHRCSVHTDPVDSTRADLVDIAKVLINGKLA